MKHQELGRSGGEGWRWRLSVFVMVGVVITLGGCATPSMKRVQAVDSSERSVKFLYSQYVDAEVGYKRGVIECDLEDQELVNCRELQVEYR